MIFPKRCLGCPPFLGYICWPKIVGALLLLSAPLPYFLSGVPEHRFDISLLYRKHYKCGDGAHGLRTTLAGFLEVILSTLSGGGGKTPNKTAKIFVIELVLSFVYQLRNAVERYSFLLIPVICSDPQFILLHFHSSCHISPCFKQYLLSVCCRCNIGICTCLLSQSSSNFCEV